MLVPDTTAATQDPVHLRAFDRRLLERCIGGDAGRSPETVFQPDCRAFCTSKLDFQQEALLEQIVGDLREPYQIQPSICGGERANLLFTRQRVPITVMKLESSRHTRQSPEDVRNVLTFFEKFLDANAPDVMLTYGGDPTTHGMIRMARARGIPVVFMIHNFGYRNAKLFPDVDYCIVASEFARRQYRDTVGLDCETLPYPIDWTVLPLRIASLASSFVSHALRRGSLRPDAPRAGRRPGICAGGRSREIAILAVGSIPAPGNIHVLAASPGPHLLPPPCGGNTAGVDHEQVPRRDCRYLARGSRSSPSDVDALESKVGPQQCCGSRAFQLLAIGAAEGRRRSGPCFTTAGSMGGEKRLKIFKIPTEVFPASTSICALIDGRWSHAGSRKPVRFIGEGPAVVHSRSR